MQPDRAAEQKLRILFVDDEQMMLDGLAALLRKQRKVWDMAFAVSGEAALAKLATQPFDTIVSDMKMPEMDGAALLAAVKSKYPRMVRIVLSGHTDLAEVARALPVAHQYLSKPCEPQELVQTVTRAARLMSLLHDGPVKEAVGKIDRLPPVPELYLALTEALQRPEATVDDVARIIEQDLAMSSKVLQIVSSAFFGLPRRIVEVKHAVAYLGLRLVRELVLSYEVLQQYPDSRTPEGFSGERLHRHCLLTGRIASALVEGEALKQHAMVAGLLHDLGQLVLAYELPEARRLVLDVAQNEGILLHEAEARVLGVGHAEIGGYLLGLWGLPLPVVEAITNHHTPSRVEHSGFELVDALHVANFFASLGGLEADVTAPPPSLDLEHLQRLGVADRLGEWQAMAQAIVEQTALQPCAAEAIVEKLVVHPAPSKEAAPPPAEPPPVKPPVAEVATRPSKPLVLCVDDEVQVLESLKPHLRRHFEVVTATSGAEALERLAAADFAVVMSDMRMPNMSGAVLLAQVRARHPDVTRVLLTGFADVESALAAVNDGGIFRFLVKPCPPPMLLGALQDAVEQHRLVRAEKELLERTLSGAVQALAEIVELLDPASAGLTAELASVARALAESLGAPPWEVEIAVRLQQIGSVTLPSELLERVRANKGLSEEERQVIAKVPDIGQRLIAHIPRLEGVGSIIRYQDKDFDGGGYPEDHVAGQHIPLGARILHVVKAMADARARGVSDRVTLARLRRDSRRFDPAVVDVLAVHRRPDPVRYLLEVRADEILPGDRPVVDFKLLDGQLLLRAGAELTRPIIERLQQYAALRRLPDSMAVYRIVP